MSDLSTKLSALPRVGPVGAKLLHKLGLDTIQDLLFYLPFRYDDFQQLKKINDLKAGDQANIQGEIMLIQNRRSFKRKMSVTEALVADESETIKVIWFNQSFLTKNLKTGDQISLAGKVIEKQGQLIMSSPQYEKISGASLTHTAGLVPVYHLTDGLSQKQLRYFIKQSLPLSSTVIEWLPEKLRKDLKLLALNQALRQIHAPKNHEEIISAQQRLIFSELFLRQLKSQMIKRALKMQTAPLVKFQEKATRDFVADLPFQLTPDQKQAAWEILQNLENKQPMSRLLEGDVGSGKTVVAALALLNVALNQQTAVLMAPTVILAQQHLASLNKLFAKQKNIKLALLTGQKKDKSWEEANIVIGTQALIQKNIKFKNLALAIVDEQHRFGVKQRQNILDFNRQDKTVPHFLSMTATPIPRSLALAIYGDLDLSIIKELPPGRKKIVTRVVKNTDRKKAYDFIRQKLQAGQQAFVICPLIEDSDKLEVKSAKAEYEYLSQEVFPEFKLGLLHGKMRAADKEKVMAEFSSGQLDLLVSTSVIEVGIDVPKATVMAIEGAERFGLAQLHQFRGRVGRGDKQSYCLIFTAKDNLSQEKTITRLQALEKHHDGFSLAKIDLKLRGAGDIYGQVQSGFNEFQLANLFDYALIKKSNEAAAALIKDDPNLKKEPLLQKKLGAWEKAIHLE
jgi:ATP-dependent DNA helicase RecG